MEQLIDYLDSHSIAYKRVRNGIMMQCCYHDDRVPSLYVGHRKYRCYGCGVTGSRLELYKHLGIVETHETSVSAIESKPAGLAVYDGLEDGYKTDERAYAYMRGRGITKKVSRMYDVRYNPVTDSIVIPIRTSNGRTVSLYERQIRGTDKLKEPETDSKSVLFGMDVLMQHNIASKPLIIVEGEIDAMSCVQAGCGAVSSMGLLLTRPQLRQVARLRSAVYVTDSDVRDRADFYVISKRMKDQAVRCSIALHVMSIPREYARECKDLNDILVTHGVRGVRKCINIITGAIK